jgi:uncharacterized membrane protein YvbJ
MALIKCPECGTEVSDRAATCVKCGCPISKPADSPTLSSSVSDDLDLDEFNVQPFWKKHKTPLIVVAIVLAIAIVTFIDVFFGEVAL